MIRNYCIMHVPDHPEDDAMWWTGYSFDTYGSLCARWRTLRAASEALVAVSRKHCAASLRLTSWVPAERVR